MKQKLNKHSLKRFRLLKVSKYLPTYKFGFWQISGQISTISKINLYFSVPVGSTDRRFLGRPRAVFTDLGWLWRPLLLRQLHQRHIHEVQRVLEDDGMLTYISWWSLRDWLLYTLKYKGNLYFLTLYLYTSKKEMLGQ